MPWTLLLNRYTLGAIGAVLLLLAVYVWYSGKIDEAYELGYNTRQTQIMDAHQKEKDRLLAENEKLRKQDSAIIESAFKESEDVKEIIRVVEKRIPTIDTSQCYQLSADWVHNYNLTTGTACGASEVGAHCGVTETASSTDAEDT